MAVKVKTKNGKTVTILNPSEKGAKYAREIREGQRYTNDYEQKTNEKGLVEKLTPEQAAYRAGYLDHQKETNKIFKKANPNYKRKTR